jgi:hypothetical protein
MKERDSEMIRYPRRDRKAGDDQGVRVVASNRVGPANTIANLTAHEAR